MPMRGPTVNAQNRCILKTYKCREPDRHFVGFQPQTCYPAMYPSGSDKRHGSCFDSSL